MRKPTLFYAWSTSSGAKGRSTLAGVVRIIMGARRGVTVTVGKPKTGPAESARQRLVRIARSQVGVTEKPRGSNSGTKVRAYQATTTVPGTGWPWCQAFCRWAMDRAGLWRRGYRGAYVPHLEAVARRAGRWRAKPPTEDGHAYLVVYDFGRDGLADHVGVLDTVRGSNVVAIEGNTASGTGGSQDNGGGVYVRTRPLSQVRGFVRVS